LRLYWRGIRLPKSRTKKRGTVSRLLARYSALKTIHALLEQALAIAEAHKKGQ
jgi:hypothetical protein